MFKPLNLGFEWPSEQGIASIVMSSYSPLALRDMPQPKPSDAPSNLDTSIFTFEDAFEDLLAVSQGQALPDINYRYEQRKLLRSMFPTGEPAYFWLRRLRSQGLLGESGPTKLMKSVADQKWDQFNRELDSMTQAVWQAAFGEEELDETASDRERIERRQDEPLTTQQRNEERSRHNGYDPAVLETEQLRDELHKHQNFRREANDFDDLFSAIQSSFANGHSAWDSFIKLITEDHSAPSNGEHKQLQKPEGEEKQVVTKDEYVDRFGYLHTKTVVKTLDEYGNEIGSHSHYAVRPAQKEDEPVQAGEQSKEDQESGSKAEGSVQTKTGWFWK